MSSQKWPKTYFLFSTNRIVLRPRHADNSQRRHTVPTSLNTFRCCIWIDPACNDCIQFRPIYPGNRILSCICTFDRCKCRRCISIGGLCICLKLTVFVIFKTAMEVMLRCRQVMIRLWKREQEISQIWKLGDSEGFFFVEFLVN